MGKWILRLVVLLVAAAGAAGGAAWWLRQQAITPFQGFAGDEVFECFDAERELALGIGIASCRGCG